RIGVATADTTVDVVTTMVPRTICGMKGTSSAIGGPNNERVMLATYWISSTTSTIPNVRHQLFRVRCQLRESAAVGPAPSASSTGTATAQRTRIHSESGSRMQVKASSPTSA